MSSETEYPASIAPDWIAVDWGTSNLRAWAMTADGTPLAMKSSDQGMSGLSPEGFEPVLLSLIAPWLGESKTPVIACGMVGSRQGWREVPYRSVPATPLGGLTACPAHDPRISVHILPGLKQSSPPDVMRGEETQIAGFIAKNPDFDGVLCMPGTHTKWVHISAGEVVSFQTFMTGESFALLSEHSVLRHSVEGDDWDDEAFQQSVRRILSRPESLAGELFHIRASHLLENTKPATSRARLSGLLIGAELAAAKPYWLGQKVALVGEPRLNSIYSAALHVQGLDPLLNTGDDATLSGLAAAYKELIE